jgi:uncharacterized membrane protein YoaT (DUF817 family)
LNEKLVLVGIDHEFTIIAILVINRLKILYITSLGTLDEHAVIITNHMLGVNLDQFAIVARAVIALPRKAGRAIDGESGAV